ncbi:DNA alkylation repair protein [Rhodoferax sp. BLA1]|uniref:DNA alkylation repair protein n=1 Tax=Rhodoferax sp. BLA1 TaxID=2576062 RepID=UPI0015D219D0|nr:DNA alkylation repair protein [Rhodoferax sp. BLA1]
MAEPLIKQYGADVPQAITSMIAPVYPAFDSAGFVAEVMDGFEELALMARGQHIARALRRFLPGDYPEALAILMASVEQPHGRDPSLTLGSFLYLPHTLFVASYGLDHFEASMAAQHALTQRFSAEFSIRPFLEQHTQATLARFRVWATDPSEHVRRLVSEGSRPRLPWAPRLRQFQADPTPVLALLELLKDDPALYVRRSVANNLNDIGKDHPELLTRITQAWLQDASPERAWIVNHALRSAVKRGEAGALTVLGFGQAAQLAVGQVQISPGQAVMGGAVQISFALTNAQKQPQKVLVDLAVHYVKANGQTRAKVFKLTTLELAPGQTVQLSKKLSLAEMTTRKHYPGAHPVAVLLNGQAQPLGAFELVPG